ncbi:hypothetical protein DPMN_172934 [Dreissena polymorpha]|uniref:Uncharacterized protein n=1 Tax=Dreissena polymorpha TaxID=45954 RepID=A0A9D4E1X5_DREPO|nr:hypothetical protein DPMN_172934 [Dreissena polymorpha]
MHRQIGWLLTTTKAVSVKKRRPWDLSAFTWRLLVTSWRPNYVLCRSSMTLLRSQSFDYDQKCDRVAYDVLTLSCVANVSWSV